MVHSEMHQYEVVVIFPPQLVGERLEESKKSFEDQVRKQGGKVLSGREMGKRSFGFPIKKQREGLYVVFDLDLDPKKVEDFKKILSLTDSILRFSILLREPVRTPSYTASNPKPVPTAVPHQSHSPGHRKV